MKLILKQYLELLKESRELDLLIPDLLLNLNIEPISSAQKGVREYGVDIAAVGKDEKGIKTLFLFTIKQGDLDRGDWNSGIQAIRQSLDDIKDTYIPFHIRPEHKDLPVKIILSTGGVLKTSVEQSWNGYVTSNTNNGKIKYEFWGGDKLSILIEDNICNEQIFPDHLRSSIRKTLALLDDPDYDLADYNSLLNGVLVRDNIVTKNGNINKKKILKTLRLTNLCQNLILKWATDNNNLLPAIIAAESTLLKTWEFLRANDLLEKSYVKENYRDLFNSFEKVAFNYFSKIQPYCYIENGLNVNEGHYLHTCTILFKQLGIVGIFAHIKLHELSSNINSEINIELFGDDSSIIETIKALINNHKSLSSPCYDDHIIEINIAINVLAICGETDFIEEWLKNIIDNIWFSYVSMGSYFPISSDKFDDLIELNILGNIPKQEMFKLSTLIPILAQWAVMLDLDALYNHIKLRSDEAFQDCVFQVWHPDEDTEGVIYNVNAGYHSGIANANIELSEDMNDVRQSITDFSEHGVTLGSFSAHKLGYQILLFLSGRLYRTPPIPQYWQLMNKQE